MNWQNPTAPTNGKAPVAAPLLWGVADCMTALGVGRTKLWEIAKDGRLGPTIYIGKNPKWQVENVRAYASKGDAA